MNDRAAVWQTDDESGRSELVWPAENARTRAAQQLCTLLATLTRDAGDVAYYLGNDDDAHAYQLYDGYSVWQGLERLTVSLNLAMEELRAAMNAHRVEGSTHGE